MPLWNSVQIKTPRRTQIATTYQIPDLIYSANPSHSSRKQATPPRKHLLQSRKHSSQPHAHRSFCIILRASKVRDLTNPTAVLRAACPAALLTLESLYPTSLISQILKKQQNPYEIPVVSGAGGLPSCQPEETNKLPGQTDIIDVCRRLSAAVLVLLHESRWGSTLLLAGNPTSCPRASFVAFVSAVESKEFYRGLAIPENERRLVPN